MSMTDISVCKRLNNNKRKYLLVNKLQAKHYPVSPSNCLAQFDALGDEVACEYRADEVLIIGFAETATAIGFHIAKRFGFDYITTTREPYSNESNFYYFSEDHSHATEQKLRKIDYSAYRQVIFIEDEVTTGNTIMHIINILKADYPSLEFQVYSIVNGMSEQDLGKFESAGIYVGWLRKVDNSVFDDMVNDVVDDGDVIKISEDDRIPAYDLFEVGTFTDVRVNSCGSFDKLVAILMRAAADCIECGYGDVLVLGTEEFMYPSLLFGSIIEKVSYTEVACHSTTRSPIVVSKNNKYLLHERHELPSVYDSERKTYIYNLGRHEKVYIITEKRANEIPLVNAVYKAGNMDITVYKVDTGEVR